MSILFGVCMVLVFALWVFVAATAFQGEATGERDWLAGYIALTLALIGMCHWAHYVTL